MIFATPHISDEEAHVLREIDDLRAQVADRVAEQQPRRWLGQLRRMTFARAVQGSNSIEGYLATLDDAAAVVDGDDTLDASADTVLALRGYRQAMTYVLQIAGDADVAIDEGLLRSLHFMMISHDLGKAPGQWRRGDIYVRNEASGQIVYTGPDRELVPDLMAELSANLAAGDGPPIVQAAMAHLNLVMIHPFADGNGRMGRCLQTLVLGRSDIVSPTFSSIEEYLGRNTQAYYDVLGLVGHGSWQPQRDARPWVRFCLTAHHRQARTLLRRVEEAERLWLKCEVLVAIEELPERMIPALWEGAHGYRIRNSTYRHIVTTSAGEEVTEHTASRDLRTLVDKRLLEAVGETRGRYYHGTRRLRALWDEIQAERTPDGDGDPFPGSADDVPEGQIGLFGDAD